MGVTDYVTRPVDANELKARGTIPDSTPSAFKSGYGIFTKKVYPWRILMS
jgi:hypothetical protein